MGDNEAGTTYDLRAFRAENRHALQVTDAVRADAAVAYAMADGMLDPALATQLHDDIARVVSLFPHYRKKELLVLPHLERHEGRDVQALTEGMWDRDDQARSFVGTACALMPGTQERPSAGNLQSIAGLLEDACDTADSMVAEEESELVPLMRDTLDDADWASIAAGEAQMRPSVVDDTTTWRPSPLDIAEARIRAMTAGAGA